MMSRFRTTLLMLIAIFLATIQSYGQTCIFLGSGSGNGKNWNRAANWSCGHVPDASQDDILIPAGRYVENNGNNDFSFDSGNTITILGSLNMKNKKIEINDNNSSLVMGSAATLTNTKELFFNSGGSGDISASSVDIDHLKVDDNSVLALNGRCVSVNDKLENLSTAEISGTGCITYGGSDGDFVNSSSKGIFGCTGSSPSDCSLDGLVTLPVELSKFTVSQESNIITFDWTTLSEINNYSFSIEVLTDRGWNSIGWTKGQGTSTNESFYSYETLSAYDNSTLFRLKQTDFDGTVSYSKVIALNLKEAELASLSISPNPAQTFVNIEGIETGVLKVYTVQGIQLDEINISGQSKIDLFNYPSGILIFQLGNSTVRIVKQ